MAERTPLPHQNFAEHRWKAYKRNVDWFMNWRNVPGYAWLLSEWIADVMNHTAGNPSTGDLRYKF
jgi:hypothetical protein